MSFLNRLLGYKQSNSKETAKNRLQVILVHDRVDLSPGKIEALKSELADVISKYVAVDFERIDITLTDSNRESHLIANVPITGGARQK